VEQHRIGEDAVEARVGEFHGEQILPPHLQPLCSRAMIAKGSEPSRPIATWRPRERLEVSARPQPRSRIANGGAPSMRSSSAAIFG